MCQNKKTFVICFFIRHGITRSSPKKNKANLRNPCNPVPIERKTERTKRGGRRIRNCGFAPPTQSSSYRLPPLPARPCGVEVPCRTAWNATDGLQRSRGSWAGLVSRYFQSGFLPLRPYMDPYTDSADGHRTLPY